MPYCLSKGGMLQLLDDQEFIQTILFSEEKTGLSMEGRMLCLLQHAGKAVAAYNRPSDA